MYIYSSALIFKREMQAGKGISNTAQVSAHTSLRLANEFWGNVIKTKPNARIGRTYRSQQLLLADNNEVCPPSFLCIQGRPWRGVKGGRAHLSHWMSDDDPAWSDRSLNVLLFCALAPCPRAGNHSCEFFEFHVNKVSAWETNAIVNFGNLLGFNERISCEHASSV
jgi:hypothetical protein